MNKEFFTDNISDEVLADITDKMLRFEKNKKNRSIKASLLKIIPAVAVIALVIGLMNMLPAIITFINSTDEVPPDGTEAVEDDDMHIFIANTKNGVQTFVPIMIIKSSFEDSVLAVITEPKDLRTIKSYYKLVDVSDPDLTARMKKILIVTYPICATTPIYVLDASTSEREINMILGIWNKYSQLIVTKMEENDIYNATG